MPLSCPPFASGLRTLLAGVGLLAGLGAPLPDACAQSRGTLYSDGRSGAEVYVGAVAQRVRYADRTTRQVSAPLYARVPLGRRFVFALHTAGALTSGDELNDLSGLADIQTALSGLFMLGRAGLVLYLDAGVPVGTERLDTDEFRTLLFSSQEQFAFAIPVLGIGPSVSPGLTLALPLSDTFVLGLGAAYRLRGGFEPVADMEHPFEPGDERLLTAGLDLQINPDLTASADVTYAQYAPDVIDDDEVFESGDRLILSGRLRFRPGFHTFALEGRFRSRARNELGAVGFLGGATETETPDQFETRARARLRAGQRLHVALDAQMRHFSGTRVLPDIRNVLRLGAGIDVAVDDQITLPVRLGYTGGDVSGFDAAVGLRLEL